MPTLDTLVIYVPVAVVMAFTPGPATLFVLSRAASLGRRTGLISAAGIMSGTAVLIVLAAAGLTGVLAASPAAFEIVKDAGAAYLVYLGVRAWRAAAGADPFAGAPSSAIPPGRAYRDGIVTELLNPKAALFYASVLPQFVDPRRGAPALQVLALGAVFCARASVALSLIAFGAGSMMVRIARRPAWLVIARRVFGAVLFGVGLRLAAGRAH